MVVKNRVPMRLLFAGILAFFLAVATPGMAKVTAVAIGLESPAREKLQTRFYKGLTEKKALPLCAKAFNQSGDTVTLVSDELALIRAWKEEEIAGR